MIRFWRPNRISLQSGDQILAMTKNHDTFKCNLDKISNINKAYKKIDKPNWSLNESMPLTVTETNFNKGFNKHDLF